MLPVSQTWEADVISLQSELHCPALCFCLLLRSETPFWCAKPFTLPLCRSPSVHEQTGVRHSWQLRLLRDGRGASRKIFALWYCWKTELFMGFVVLATLQIQIKRVLFFWMLLIHSFYFFFFFSLPKLDGYFCELWLWGWSCPANWQWCSGVILVTS